MNLNTSIRSKCPECGFETQGSRFPKCYSCGAEILGMAELTPNNAQPSAAKDNTEESKQRDFAQDDGVVSAGLDIIEAVIDIGLPDLF